MERNIITIDENKCNGCGQCIPNCPEGAIQIIDEKARLISDLFCDGLGACLGHCPEGAIKIERREAEAYQEKLVMENVVKAGVNTIKAHLKHLKEHNEIEFLNQAIEYLNENNISVPSYEEEAKLPCGCPGTLSQDLRKEKDAKPSTQKIATDTSSELANWPVQLQLINPAAPYIKNADLVIAADCTAFAYKNFQNKFLTDKVLIILCPKLDQTHDEYVDKLSAIFETQNIQSISIVHMEVPCCSGVESIVKAGLKKSAINIVIKDYTVSISGELI